MALTEEEMNQKQARINELQNLLEQMDYSGRKVAFEVARLMKQFHPEAETPALDEYTEGEAMADDWREEISRLRKELDGNV